MQRLLYLIGRGVRETGQALDRVGCRLQGNFSFREQLSRHHRLIPLYDKKPSVGAETFIAPNAAVIGRVQVGDQATVWYGACLRGDINDIKVGKNSHIGDRVVVHARSQTSNQSGLPALIGDNVVIGQGSILHACTVADNCLIEMGCTILDGAIIGANSIVGPGSLVLQNTAVPEKQYWAGSPAKYIRDVSAEEIKYIATAADNWFKLGRTHDEHHNLTSFERAREHENWEEDPQGEEGEDLSARFLSSDSRLRVQRDLEKEKQKVDDIPQHRKKN